LVGGGLLYRGMSGHCPVYARLGSAHAEQGGSLSLLSMTHHQPEHERTITIGRSEQELFRMWQDPEVQTKIMAHFAKVSRAEEGRLRWEVRAPLGKLLRFETQRTETRENELLVWRSTPGGDLDTVWTLRLRKGPGAYGTELTLRVRMEPTGGLVPHMLNKLLGAPIRVLIERTLRNFKALVESGEIPSTYHNPSHRRGARSDAEAPHALHASY
jgi:uncharacterized membrane protein